MSDHGVALVPISPWAYLSPDLRRSGHNADIGLLCESLLYYDRIAVIPSDAPALEALVSWFVQQDKVEELLSLLRDGTMAFYHYKFNAAIARKPGEVAWSIWNVNRDPPFANTFTSQVLGNINLRKIIPDKATMQKFYRVVRDNVTEVDPGDFSEAVENARHDFQDPESAALLVQALVDDVYKLAGWKHPPAVTASVVKEGDTTTYAWNIDFAKLGQALGDRVNLKPEDAIRAIAETNRIIWSASLVNCDIFLHTPLSTLVGNKLYEAGEKIGRAHDIIEQLKFEVEFPDVRRLVNACELSLDDVFAIRHKAKRFRQWLQDESERDRNTLIAYHQEVAKTSGFAKSATISLSLFGLLVGSAVGGAISGTAPGAIGGASGALVGAGLKYVFDLASKVRGDWRPVVFGDWARERVQASLERRERG